MRQTVLKIALLLGGMIAIAVMVSLLTPGRTPVVIEALPSPNGYDVFVEAGKLLPRIAPNMKSLPAADLNAFLTANSNVLARARQGLNMESRVPLEFSRSYLTNHFKELLPLRNLGQVFALDGQLAELENRTNDAMNAYLDLIQLGMASSRGGQVIDALIGTASQSLAVAPLRRMSSELDAGQCRHSVARLESCEALAEPWRSFDERDKSSSRAASTLQERITSIVASKSTAAAKKKAEQRFNEGALERRELLIALAARAFELEKGAPPKSILDLVPTYLKTIPIDPLTGARMEIPGKAGR